MHCSFSHFRYILPKPQQWQWEGQDVLCVSDECKQHHSHNTVSWRPRFPVWADGSRLPQSLLYSLNRVRGHAGPKVPQDTSYHRSSNFTHTVFIREIFSEDLNTFLQEEKKINCYLPLSQLSKVLQFYPNHTKNAKWYSASGGCILSSL